jgi:hypothetical protein
MSEATNNYNVIPANPENAAMTREYLGELANNAIGKVIDASGGIFFDHGWLRLLGSASEEITRDVHSWNLSRSYEEGDKVGFLMVADDVLGGIYAVNKGEFGEDLDNLYYFAPDTLEWEPLEITYDEFLSFCFTGDMETFYNMFRWEGWQNDVANISGDEAFVFDSPLWDGAEEEMDSRKRQVLPMDAMYDLLLEMNNLMVNENEEEHEHDCDVHTEGRHE